MKRLDVDAMLGELTAEQFNEWRAYSEIEPFGSLRDDYRAAQVGAAIVNNIPLRGAGARRVKPSDFFDTLAPKTRQSKREMIGAAHAFVASMGGSVIKVGQGEGAGKQGG